MAVFFMDLSSGNLDPLVEVYGRLEGKCRRGRKVCIICLPKKQASYYIKLGYLPQWEGNYVDLEIRERRDK